VAANSGPKPERGKRGSWAAAISVLVYRFFLYAYPKAFRQSYGERMTRVFADQCRVSLREFGVAALIPLWFSTCSDLVVAAGSERWQSWKEKVGSMALQSDTTMFPLRLWAALAATLITFLVCLVASLNLYLLEDGSSLTLAAYSASPLLRFSYDGVYLSALAAGVAVGAIVGYALLPRRLLVTVGIIGLSVMVALGGFGGLLWRHPTTFLVFLLFFGSLTLGSFFLGRVVMSRAERSLEQRPAAILGACVSACSLLLVNVVTLVLHTVSLNPVSHALYMQGQIEGTHLNFSLLITGLALLTLLACVVCLGRALGSLAR
jgi:hypothetical protein